MDAETLGKYKKAGDINARARALGASLIAPGVGLLEVAEKVEAFIRDQGGAPAFPCCISIDHDAAHDTPAVNDERVFVEGQVVKLDCGTHIDGFIGDTAITVEVGTDRFAEMKRAAQEALDAALRTIKPNGAVEDVSAAVEQVIRSFGFQPVANLTGHSVDQYHQHAGISIPSVAATAHGKFTPDTAVAIEPFVTDGRGRVKDSVGGNIYHFMGARPVRDKYARQALDHIKIHHDQLPFAGRWLADVLPPERVPQALRFLERSGAVKQYPVLREIGGGQVTQFEHTMVILEDEIVVTTLDP